MNETPTAHFPVLTTAERDRRWARVRAFLAARDLDAVIVLGLKGREPFEPYLANENTDGGVIFPADGDPIQLTWATHRVTRRYGAGAQGGQVWIEDLRVGPFSQRIIEAVKERELTRSRIGVVGLDSRNAGEPQGLIPYRTWSHVLAELSDVQFQDVSFDFGLLMLPKSDEELVLVRHACEIGEHACRALLDQTAPGASEPELYAAVVGEVLRRGAATASPHLNLFTGPAELGWGPPLWTQASWAPRTLAAGDLVQAEIFSVYGGFETQQQMTIAVEPVTAQHREMAAVAEQSCRAGVAAMRPGATFGAVCDALAEPLQEAGYWHGPLIHSLSPMVLVSGRHSGVDVVAGRRSGSGRSPDVGADVVLEPGMVFAVEPDVCRDLHRVVLGATVVVTGEGAQELNTLTNTLHVVR